MSLDTSNAASPRPASGAPGSAPSAALSAEEKLSGDMLVFTTGFMVCASMLWLVIYWSMGYLLDGDPVHFQVHRAHTGAVSRLKNSTSSRYPFGVFFTPSRCSGRSAKLREFRRSPGLMAPVGAVTVLARATRLRGSYAGSSDVRGVSLHARGQPRPTTADWCLFFVLNSPARGEIYARCYFAARTAGSRWTRSTAVLVEREEKPLTPAARIAIA